ncbi:hypothetical protein KBI23_01880 [bacterium]|nr:hypothetical protein [bacterium]MBP9808780.1 hypothetical protein [bacterium]
MPFIQANQATQKSVKKLAKKQTNKNIFPAILPTCLLVAISQLSGVQAQTTTLSSGQSLGPELRPALKAASAKAIRTDTATAVKMARMRWLDKMVTADPGLVAAICSHAASARVLAAHPHLDKIAEADHYTCRRITKWGSAAVVLTKNPQALRVVTLDPEGIYRAIKHDRTIARRLTKNANFNQMVVENPDLGKLLSSYM